MSEPARPLRTLLDAGVPDSVGTVFQRHGHVVILHRQVLLDKTPDTVVCATALANQAILISFDSDMKQLAKRYGVAPKRDRRFDRLNMIRLCCNELLAPKRVEQALSLIEHEWSFCEEKVARRLWIDIGPHFIRTNR